MKTGHPATFIAWRFYLLLFFIFLMIVGLVLRVVDLTIIKQPFLKAQGDARVIRSVEIPAFRGIITDRNGYPLAISASVFSVWINPKEFTYTSLYLTKLSHLLAVPSDKIQSIVNHSKLKGREFTYLKRDVSPQIAKQIKSLKLPGLYLQPDYKRYYPEAEVAAHLVGFTNVDDEGQEGLELAYNDWLKGKSGKKRVIKDRLGREISIVQALREQKPGHDLVLSINRRIQYLAYRELVEGVATNQAESGSIVVLDAKTGEILAVTNWPSFNPNRFPSKRDNSFRNRALTDVFEPGSIIKAFSVASAIDSGRYKPDTVIDTAPGWMRVGHNLVKDEHNNHNLTVTQALQLSSNVGITKMILSLPPNQLWSLLHRVGFGEITGTSFPGERAGMLPRRTTWKPFTLATLAFGYGISVTPLQLAQAYGVLANNGMKIPLSLLRMDKPPVGEQVMDPTVAHQMLHLLEAVVSKGGTGERAHIPGYRVAGKTGTAEMVGIKGYQKQHNISSFVGIAPVTDPRLVVAVVIRDPQGKNHHGGFVAAPVFEKVMEGALLSLNIPPDDKVNAS